MHLQKYTGPVDSSRYEKLIGGNLVFPPVGYYRIDSQGDLEGRSQPDDICWNYGQNCWAYVVLGSDGKWPMTKFFHMLMRHQAPVNQVTIE